MFSRSSATISVPRTDDGSTSETGLGRLREGSHRPARMRATQHKARLPIYDVVEPVTASGDLPTTE